VTITETVPNFASDTVLVDSTLFDKVQIMHEARDEETDTAVLAGAIIEKCEPNIEHNIVSRKHTWLPDGAELWLFRGQPVSGPVFWKPEVTDLWHVTYDQPTGRRYVYVSRTDGQQTLFVTDKTSTDILEQEAIDSGAFAATDVGVRELMTAVESSLAGGAEGEG
jgi:hypothetical protein